MDLNRILSSNVPVEEINGFTVEPLILPIVNILNSIEGIRTVASCQGHFLDGAISEPYIAYYSSIETAKSIQFFLNNYELKLPWYQLIIFNDEYDPFFSIRVNKEALFLSKVPFWAFFLPGQAKKHIEHEIHECLKQDLYRFRLLPELINSKPFG